MSSYGKGVNSVAVANGKVAVAVEDGNDTVGKKQLKGSVVLLNTDGSYVDINFSTATLTDANDGTVVRLGATPSNNQAKDLEPEYATVSGNYAYVTLQENNAIAKVDLTTNSLAYVKSFGAKSWEVDSGNTIDIEEEGEVKMSPYPGLFGLYQPDSIASYISNGATYLVTANEGDGREYEGDTNTFVDEEKIKTLDLGDTDQDGEYEKLYTYGARSFSIWDANGDLVFDSGDQISKKVAALQPELFNQDEGEMDGRSGNKGAEPEALTVGNVDGKTYAFIGLERQNAIMVYDITTPTAPIFLDYIITEIEGDISPEGMQFVPARESPNGKNLLLVSFEVSGSTVVYEVQ